MSSSDRKPPTVTSSEETLEKRELSIHSLHSSSSSEAGDNGDIEAIPHTVSSNVEKSNDGGVVEKIVTRLTTRSIQDGPPPDGGTGAWLIVFFAHLVIMNTWGFVNSFGVFQTYYVTALNRPPSDIAWVGSIQVFLLFFIGTFSGRLTDAGFFRPVFFTGTVLALLGLFMTSLAKTYTQLFLSQGICIGIGNSMIFTPTVAMVSTYFSTNRALAIGLAAAGSSTGGIVFPLMVQQLLPKIGFAWTIRSLGLIQFICLGAANFGLRTRTRPRKNRAFIDRDSLSDWPYLLFAAGIFFTFLGVYIAFYYIGSFARSIIGVPYSESINLLVVLNAVGVIGRIFPNYLADRYFGPLNTLIPSVVVSSLLSFCWIAVTNRGGLYAWAIVYGISSSMVQGLFPATLSSLTPDLRKAGTRMGQVFTTVSFAVLSGPPIAGALVVRGGGSYVYTQIFAGLALAIGSCLLIASRLVRSPKLMHKM